ncbi:MAG TPA: DUF3592 domain-containing protein [Thermoanaerobaculia bacterium]|jgi:hypothetical protein|nr:DUF3592 domain-containing protein [Thermoanaerobaculia bacterium]
MVTQPLSSRRGGSFPSGCLVLFFAVFFLVGLAAFYFVTLRPVMSYVAARSWQETTCTVLSSQVGTHSGSDSTTYSVDVVYTYVLDGRAYQSDRYGFLGGSSSGRTGKEEIVARYPPGARVSCWVDPAHPDQAVLSREPAAEWLIGLVPLAFLLIGAGGIVWSLRMSQRARAAATALPMAPAEAFGVQAPAVLGGAAGGSLELKPAATPLGKLIALILVALFWNGIISVFVWQAAKGWRTGGPDGCLTLFLVPFVLIGLGLIFAAGRQFLILFNPRLHLTLTPGTLAAGESGYLQWSFSSGGGGVKRLTIVLEGREEARYRRGTNTYTDKAVFATLTLVDTRQELEIPSGGASFAVPADSMPSFSAPHNKIRWALKAHGDIPGWPDSDDEYEVLVRPGRGA